ncbi:hypothetical protein JG688_00006118 [Phytophthora aleatoria]|uniref:Uncharacterized protein n=1 Tax=Phytophthora aleatoria TaxID=2496075 RepID=A0A8J5IZY7_9STRA|nr:hypothetical protein JG688_00006118 [Phytophthora aleatoria]
MLLLCGQRLSTTTVELIEPSILEGVEGEKWPSSSTGSPTYWYIIAARYVRRSGTTLPNYEVYARLSQEAYERKNTGDFSVPALKLESRYERDHVDGSMERQKRGNRRQRRMLYSRVVYRTNFFCSNMEQFPVEIEEALTINIVALLYLQLYNIIFVFQALSGNISQ